MIAIGLSIEHDQILSINPTFHTAHTANAYAANRGAAHIAAPKAAINSDAHGALNSGLTSLHAAVSTSTSPVGPSSSVESRAFYFLGMLDLLLL